MIREERFRVFLSSMEPDLPPFLDRLEQDCVREGIPIIRPQMRSLLRVLLPLAGPSRILEIGTAVGFSALFMCRYCSTLRELVTIEADPVRADTARSHIRSAGCQDRIRVVEGDASRVLPLLQDSFDLILTDAAKGQYIHWLPDMRRLMRTGSVLVSDNVLQEGRLLEPRCLVERRDRTIYGRMRDYLWQLSHDPELATTILPIGDGVALSVKVSGKPDGVSVPAGTDGIRGEP